MTSGASPTTGRTAWWRATVAVALGWLVTMLVVVIATGALGANEATAVSPLPGFGGWEVPPVDASGLELVRTGLVRFDALWYLAIAADGYPTTTGVPQAAAFLPGYPLMVAAVGVVVHDLVVAALIVSFLATVASVVGLQRLADLVVPDAGGTAGVRDATTVLTLVFPTSFFLLAPYAESLLLAASVWALLHAAEGRPGRSAALAFLATVTRPTGALVAIPLLLGVVASRRPAHGSADPDTRSSLLLRRVVPALGVAVGGAALLVYGAVLWGDPLAVVNAQDGWQRTPTSPLTTLWVGLGFGLQTLVDGSTPYHLLDVVVLGLSLAGVAVLARRREWPLVAHAVASMLLWLSQPFAGRPLMSTPRFALAVPAVVLGLALLARGDGLRRAVVPISSVLFAVHLVLFTRWWFVF